MSYKPKIIVTQCVVQFCDRIAPVTAWSVCSVHQMADEMMNHVTELHDTIHRITKTTCFQSVCRTYTILAKAQGKLEIPGRTKTCIKNCERSETWTEHLGRLRAAKRQERINISKSIIRKTQEGAI